MALPLAVLKPVGKVAVALLDTKVARGLGKGAFHVVNTPLRIAVHGGLGNIHKGAHDWVSKHLNRMGFRVCFVAGTPIVGPWGSKAIEDYKDYETYGDDCDTLISRDEFNDDGILTVRRVLRKFERIGPVLDVVIQGQRIGTTHEHPFFVKGKGWTKAQELRVGDDVRLMQPGWATVEAVEDTGRLERVYNLEVEDDHTYFVGDEATWGFAVWAHNSYGEFERIVTDARLKTRLTTTQASLAYFKDAKSGEAALRQGLKDAGLHHTAIERAVAVAKQDGAVAGVMRDVSAADLLGKPPYSPDVKKWRTAGGKVEVDSTGTWVYTDAANNRVAYPRGSPDFRGAGLVKDTVDIFPEYKGNYTTDFTTADSLSMVGRNPRTETWHHHENLHSLDLIDKVTHAKFTHSGGVSIIANRGGVP